MVLYPSNDNTSIVTEIQDYFYDNTGGPRGQLAVHPAAGQFVLDNASNRNNPACINAIDEILKQAKLKDVPYDLHNGYLALPKPSSQEECDNHYALLKQHLHTLRPLVMENVPASGVIPSKRDFVGGTEHTVSLVYASAVPLETYNNVPDNEMQKKFHKKCAEAILFAQYYGALRFAAKRYTDSKVQVFLMPLGGGVFNNSWDSIGQSMSRAVELLDPGDREKLDIKVLTWKGNADEKAFVAEVLTEHKKLRT